MKNMKQILTSLLVLGLMAGASFNATAKEKKSKLEAKAKISKADALKTAQVKVPTGKVIDSELEEENGKLVWSFDFALPGTKDITEVQVDAVTGEIVSVEIETPAQQEKEKKEKEQEKKDKEKKEKN